MISEIRPRRPWVGKAVSTRHTELGNVANSTHRELASGPAQGRALFRVLVVTALAHLAACLCHRVALALVAPTPVFDPLKWVDATLRGRTILGCLAQLAAGVISAGRNLAYGTGLALFLFTIPAHRDRPGRCAGEVAPKDDRATPAFWAVDRRRGAWVPEADADVFVWEVIADANLFLGAG